MSAHSPSLAVYQDRRQRIAKSLGSDALVLFGGVQQTRSADIEFRFRPDSDFYYLTGLEEPGAVLVLRPDREQPFTLFMRPRDEKSETWFGKRLGPEGAKEHFAADEAFSLEELDTELPKLLDGCKAVHLPLGLYPQLEAAVTKATAWLKKKHRDGVEPPEAFIDASILMSEDRIIKDPAAMESLQQAIDLSASAHIEAMKATRPGVNEYEIEALIDYHFRKNGSSGPGYTSIVAGGANATCLHYIENNKPLKEGELLLVDAGGEWDYFSGDITRTYPISGKFSPLQRDLYQIVLESELAGIRKSVIGESLRSIHESCVYVLCKAFSELKLIDQSPDEIFENESYKRFYMHRTSHWLGADVHDAGRYIIDGSPRKLQKDHVFTIEPGIYIRADDDSVPPEFRGIGVRIEDDILVTEGEAKVLSVAAPKTVDELEAIVGQN